MKGEKIACFGIVAVLIGILLLCGYSVRTTKRLGECIRELERTRAELERARDQQQIIVTAIDYCSELAQDTGAVLGRATHTVADLREQLTEIRANYENMERMLRDNWDAIHSVNDNADSDKEVRESD